MALFHSHRKPDICQVPRGILRRHQKVETVPRRFKYAYSASTDYSLGKRTITPWVVVAKFLGWKIADWKKSALSTPLIKVHSLPDVQRSNKSLSTLFYFSSPWSCRRFLAVCLIWCPSLVSRGANYSVQPTVIKPFAHSPSCNSPLRPCCPHNMSLGVTTMFQFHLDRGMLVLSITCLLWHVSRLLYT